jgi:8-oxo-dGTP pyrophosphatase MutT (NUDIX family)
VPPPDTEPDEVVRAAGGVVWRPAGGGVEVLVVHRPKYDDWSLPKGKRHEGESDQDAALREVEEETGLRCTLVRELPSISYNDRQGRAKVVRYWEMRPEGGSFTPTDEVDEVRWMPPDQLAPFLSYDRDRDVVAALKR